MAMLPQSSVGEIDREIQTRPPAERQSQLPKYLLSRVCTTINVNSSPHSAAYVRRWIGSAGQTFRYSQELSPGPLVYRNKLQWNLNQNRKLFIHGNASEYIVCEMAAIMSRGSKGGGWGGVGGGWGGGWGGGGGSGWGWGGGGGGVEGGGVVVVEGGGGGGGGWRVDKHAVWPAKCIVNTHVWINLYQFHWNVLWKVTMTLNEISKYNWRSGLVFINSHYMSQRKPIFYMLLRGLNECKCFGVIGFMKWWRMRGTLGELVTLRIMNLVPNKWNCIGQGNDLAHNRIPNVTWASHNPVHWPMYMYA